MDWFDVFRDERGIASLKPTPSAVDRLAVQMRNMDEQGLSTYAALLVLQDRLARLEALLRRGPIAARSAAGNAHHPAKGEVR